MSSTRRNSPYKWQSSCAAKENAWLDMRLAQCSVAQKRHADNARLQVTCTPTSGNNVGAFGSFFFALGCKEGKGHIVTLRFVVMLDVTRNVQGKSRAHSQTSQAGPHPWKGPIKARGDRACCDDAAMPSHDSCGDAGLRCTGHAWQ